MANLNLKILNPALEKYNSLSDRDKKILKIAIPFVFMVISGYLVLHEFSYHNDLTNKINSLPSKDQLALQKRNLEILVSKYNNEIENKEQKLSSYQNEIENSYGIDFNKNEALTQTKAQDNIYKILRKAALDNNGFVINVDFSSSSPLEFSIPKESTGKPQVKDKNESNKSKEISPDYSLGAFDLKSTFYMPSSRVEAFLNELSNSNITFYVKNITITPLSYKNLNTNTLSSSPLIYKLNNYIKLDVDFVVISNLVEAHPKSINKTNIKESKKVS